jgi:hypothetical protein
MGGRKVTVQLRDESAWVGSCHGVNLLTATRNEATGGAMAASRANASLDGAPAASGRLETPRPPQVLTPRSLGGGLASWSRQFRVRAVSLRGNPRKLPIYVMVRKEKPRAWEADVEWGSGQHHKRPPRANVARPMPLHMGQDKPHAGISITLSPHLPPLYL